MAKKTYGKTASGKPITDELVDGLADKAERAMTSTRRSAAEVGGHRFGPLPPAWNRSGSTPSYVRRSPSEPSATATTSSVIRKALRKASKSADHRPAGTTLRPRLPMSALASMGTRHGVAVHVHPPWAARSRRPRGPGAGPRPAPRRRRTRPRVAGRLARPRAPGSPRRGVARVPEEVETAPSRRGAAYGTECGLRPPPRRSDVEGEDLVEAAIAEVGVLQRDGLEHSPARVDVLAVPPRVAISIILGERSIAGDRSRRQPLADQGDPDAVAAADLEQAVGRADLQGVDRPDEPMPCPPCLSNSITPRP